jgi:hypothetical protein
MQGAHLHELHKSVKAEHTVATGRWIITTVLPRAAGYMHRAVVQVIQIGLHPDSFNRHKGFTLSRPRKRIPTYYNEVGRRETMEGRSNDRWQPENRLCGEYRLTAPTVKLLVYCQTRTPGPRELLWVYHRVYHLKRNPTTITYYGTKIKEEAGPFHKKTLPTSPVTLDPKSPLLLGRCSSQLHKNCARANIVYSRAENVFIVDISIVIFETEHYFISKLKRTSGFNTMGPRPHCEHTNCLTARVLR